MKTITRNNLIEAGKNQFINLIKESLNQSLLKMLSNNQILSEEIQYIFLSDISGDFLNEKTKEIIRNILITDHQFKTGDFEIDKSSDEIPCILIKLNIVSILNN